MQLVLASSSAYRKKQLETLGLPFSCVKPDIDESRINNENAHDMALRLAELSLSITMMQAGMPVP